MPRSDTININFDRRIHLRVAREVIRQWIIDLAASQRAHPPLIAKIPAESRGRHHCTA